MSIPNIVFGILALLVALVVALVTGFGSLVNTLTLNIHERKLQIPPELEALYRQIGRDTGIHWAILAGWDGAENGFKIPVPSADEIFEKWLQDEIEKREEKAEKYCEEHPEDEENCPPGEVNLTPDEQVKIWEKAYARWRFLLRQHIKAHADAIEPHLMAFWKDPVFVYDKFMSSDKATLAAELFEGYQLLEDLADSHDEVLYPVTGPPAGWTPADGFAWPALGPISSRYGMRYSPIDGELRLHGGLDLAVPSGTEVRASKDGTVTQRGNSPVYGLYVVIQHDVGYQSLYAHNSTLAVALGQHVGQGDIIARSGSTGLSTGPHLHFEIHYEGTPVDPLLLLTQRVVDLGG